VSATQSFDRAQVHRACEIALTLIDELNKQAAGPVYRRREIALIGYWALANQSHGSRVMLTFEMFVAIPSEAWEQAGVVPT